MTKARGRDEDFLIPADLAFIDKTDDSLQFTITVSPSAWDGLRRVRSRLLRHNECPKNVNKMKANI